MAVLCLLGLSLLAGCSARWHKRDADREVYGIVGDKEKSVLGKDTGFNIDTPYSKREPKTIPPEEIISDRIQSGQKRITIEDALRLAVANSRLYQTRKETLYLSALTLTERRFDFTPQFFGTATARTDRQTTGERVDSVRSRVGVDQFLKTGGRLGATLFNDIFRYYTGDPSRTVSSIISVDLVQPLLRGAGAVIVAENLTQAERNVIYEVRNFQRFQQTFATDIVIAYLRLLQQRDIVRNEYSTYKSAIASRELSEALGVDGRVSRVQVDQARQRELDSRNRYLLAVERYRDTLDTFKGTLSLPLGVDLQLEEKEMDALRAVPLDPIEISETDGYALAVAQRPDLVNEIDRFEDTKRKIRVAADRLRADVNIIGGASLQSDGPTDYTKFDWNKVRADIGLQVNLPLNRLVERNIYRATFISFERQLRELGQSLDDVRDDVRQGVRGLLLARQVYDVQRNTVNLANQRVESSEMLFQAGRVQIRDLLESQDAQVRARNSFTQALIDYHATRLGLLRDLGVLNPDDAQFWLKTYPLPKPATQPAPTQIAQPIDSVVPPEKLFGN